MKTWKIHFQDAAAQWAVLGLFLYFMPPATCLATGPPPVITVQPLDQAVLKGGTAVFTVVAVSGTTLSYQWFKDDHKMPGKTASILTINNVGSKEVANYYVEVKNAGGTVDSREAKLTIRNNTAPVANNDTYNTPEDMALTVPDGGILSNDVDADGDALTALLVSDVTHGTLGLSTNGGFTYTPSANYFGGDSFTYRATDGLATGNVATVTINVTPVNDPPLARDDSTNTLEDVSVTINVLANDSDPEGTPLTITGTSTTNGTAVISGTGVVFTPSTNFNGVVVFSYTISDGTNSATANVTVTVIPVNDAPVANNDAYTTLENVPLIAPAAVGVLTNDVDVDGDALTALLVSDVSHGSLSLNPDGSFTYTPANNYVGDDSFTYRATDGLATGNVATVTITILDNTPPSLSSAEMTADGFAFQLSVPLGSTYVIMASTNIQDWTPIYTNVALTGSVVFTDTASTNYNTRLYRLMVVR